MQPVLFYPGIMVFFGNKNRKFVPDFAHKLPADICNAPTFRGAGFGRKAGWPEPEIPSGLPPYSCPMEYDPCQVYAPEADSCLLLAAALAGVRPGDRVLEVGTGSGLIAGEI